ncbi:hypothetical protein CROQUDRAFT_690408 [Cronartium quercuum f. sp. fusiforme G11]|uniref:Uncharacterized protein n=1 Tax=Cronartium quercuum f. sp. fusiforme G11 TaxID=708437 RepID=A0A9P6N6K4_9BASI|nr:hypothetical protein CROQUDRAFT_690408 [Cronartium quercuum f. sp. fusiforme G11]
MTTMTTLALPTFLIYPQDAEHSLYDTCSLVDPLEELSSSDFQITEASLPTELPVPVASPPFTTRNRAASDALEKLLAEQTRQLRAVSHAWRSKYPREGRNTSRLTYLVEEQPASDLLSASQPAATSVLETRASSHPSSLRAINLQKVSEGQSPAKRRVNDESCTTESAHSGDFSVPDDSHRLAIEQSEKPSMSEMGGKGQDLTQRALHTWSRFQRMDHEKGDPILTWLHTIAQYPEVLETDRLSDLPEPAPAAPSNIEVGF